MYYHLFDNEIASWMRQNIKIQEDNKIPTACVGLSADSGYTISVNTEFMEKLSDKGKKTVILHELMHVIRGDCIKIREVGNPMAWNMASDCHINNSVDIATVEQEAKIKSVTYQRIKKENWPDVIQATQWIYDKLNQENEGGNRSGNGSSEDSENNNSNEKDKGRNERSNNSGQSKGMESDSSNSKPDGTGESYEDFALSDDVKAAEGDLEKCKVEHSKTVMSAPKSFGISLPKVTGGGIKYEPTQNIKTLVTLNKVLKNVVPRYGTTKVKTKTWAKENRVADFFRGRARRKLAKVFVCVDVSGSMSHHVKKVIGLSQWLKDKLDITIAVWADTAQIVKDVKNIPDVGGGTQISACLSLIKKHDPDVCVIITDGEFDKMDQVPRNPIVWVLYGSKNRRSIILKKSDIIIDGE